MGPVSDVPWGTTYMWTLRKRDISVARHTLRLSPTRNMCNAEENGERLPSHERGPVFPSLVRGRGERLANAPRSGDVSFASDLREPAFASRKMFLNAGSRDGTRARAREILMMDAADYAAAFKGSAIKWAKLWMLTRNACVVLGNVGTSQELAVLHAMLTHEHEIVREHAAWATSQLQTTRAS